ncbi:aldehyde dehydrogenase family protein [Comamonas sp. NLF-1-9]|uniref:aldehyde dehydrogenase family protein n=1 Tax=Comamonas sp. NLF-1-9 TaxID=2853163 RepID=UPI001C463504|nr:aldehyde dehydrogenase family protein [Comamonas sp. NLF-1-9]QXL85715.1 aldehyde dehydrogenase family protein [Comamonas sp. NLF-1-9]
MFETPAEDLERLFQAQHRASRAQPDVPLALRRERLLRLRTLIDDHAPVLAAAVQADFGMRSRQLTEVADLFLLRAQLASTLRQLARWSRPQKVRTPLYLQPARAWVQRQPLGVVGVISPWNYPVQLALGPAIGALAAGNRVLLKPSELTPHTSAKLADLVAQFFAPEEFCVVQGGAAVAEQLSRLPLDHLVFTGSTAVGRKVALAAADKLTPTTLELGGKSPAILDADCDLADAALKIAHGKLLNAGQTCIAPDYLFVPKGSEAAFAGAFRAAVLRLFPRFEGNPDYASIITPRHLARLRELLQDAREQGAEVQQIEPAAATHGAPAQSLGDGIARQMPPALVFGVHDQMRLMQEEIFGPLLPVIGYESLDEVVGYINARPRPLSLYWFGNRTAVRDEVLAHTVSGGVTVNDTLLHIAHESLPFGGVGDSGWGAYHGEAGFVRFSHAKAVLVQSRWGAGALLYPPYGRRFERVMALLRKLL